MLIPIIIYNFEYIISKSLKITNYIINKRRLIKNKKYKNKGIKLKFIKNGEEIVIFDKNNNKFIKNKLKENIFNLDEKNYDFMLLYENNNIIRYDNFKDYLNTKERKEISKQFLTVKLFINSKIYIIDMKEPNLYIDKNILFNLEFLKWYCKENLILDLNEDDNYYIIFIDKEIKEYKLCKNYYIKLNENNYSIECSKLNNIE